MCQLHICRYDVLDAFYSVSSDTKDAMICKAILKHSQINDYQVRGYHNLDKALQLIV